MRWSTVCGEMSSWAAISFEDRWSLTRRRQSSCPGVSRATRRVNASSGSVAWGGRKYPDAPSESCNAIPKLPMIGRPPSSESRITFMLSCEFSPCFGRFQPFWSKSWMGRMAGNPQDCLCAPLVDRAGFREPSLRRELRIERVSRQRAAPHIRGGGFEHPTAPSLSGAGMTPSNFSSRVPAPVAAAAAAAAPGRRRSPGSPIRPGRSASPAAVAVAVAELPRSPGYAARRS